MSEAIIMLIILTISGLLIGSTIKSFTKGDE